MPLADIGMFLPAESHYKTPGAYDEMLKAEAAKNAAYLASMDQFYAELEEMKRQFDETLEFKEKELEVRERQHREEIDFRRKALEAETQIAKTQASAAAGHITIGRDPHSNLPSHGAPSIAEQWEFLKGYSFGGTTQAPRFTPTVYGPNQETRPVQRLQSGPAQRSLQPDWLDLYDFGSQQEETELPFFEYGRTY